MYTTEEKTLRRYKQDQQRTPASQKVFFYRRKNLLYRFRWAKIVRLSREALAGEKQGQYVWLIDHPEARPDNALLKELAELLQRWDMMEYVRLSSDNYQRGIASEIFRPILRPRSRPFYT